MSLPLLNSAVASCCIMNKAQAPRLGRVAWLLTAVLWSHLFTTTLAFFLFLKLARWFLLTALVLAASSAWSTLLHPLRGPPNFLSHL